MQELNLDWILTKIKNILRFVPDDGAVGQILRRTPSGAEWSNEQGGGGGAVNSVNGQTGDVVLTAADVGALPDTYVAPVTSVNGQTGVVSLTIPDSTSDLVNDSGFVNSAGAAAAAPVQSVNGYTGAVIIPTGITMTLLWTNNDITQSFAAQTISIDLSDYSFVDIVFSPWGGTSELAVSRFVVGATSELSYTKTSSDSTSDAQHFLNGTYRGINITATGISVGTGQMIYAGGAYQNWNNRAIPYKIYGIKF